TVSIPTASARVDTSGPEEITRTSDSPGASAQATRTSEAMRRTRARRPAGDNAVMRRVLAWGSAFTGTRSVHPSPVTPGPVGVLLTAQPASTSSELPGAG